MMSSQAEQPRTADGLLIDGVMSYEAGDVHSALASWREALILDPAHSAASRYSEFVRTQLLVDDQSSLAEVKAAQERFRRELTGEVAPPQTLMPAAPSRSESHTSNTRSAITPSAEFEVPANPQARPRAEESPAVAPAEQVEASAAPVESVNYTEPFDPSQFPMSSSDQVETMWATPEPDASQAQTTERPIVAQSAQRGAPPSPPLTSQSEEAPTQPPLNQQPVVESSPIAQSALEGPEGPRTQADGLSIQALSRQLAELHRSGQYAQAVATAEALLNKDPQHAVARRYINEYHRQREAAKSRRRTERSLSEPPQAQAAEMEESAAEEAPTRAPSALQQSQLSPTRLKRTPRILVPIEQIEWSDFDHLAGFFVSQVDGKTSYEDLIAISGMPRQEALTLLERLIERGVISD